MPTRLDLQRPKFEYLLALICHQYRHAHRWIIQDIAQGKLLPHLLMVCCNQSDFRTADYKLSDVELKDLSNLYNSLVNLRTTHSLKDDLQICLNGMLFDPNRPLAECGFSYKRIEFHYRNLDDKPTLMACPDVDQVNYLDVIETFFPQPSAQPPDQLPAQPPARPRPNKLHMFLVVYPNLRVVIVNRHKNKPISIQHLHTFLWACKDGLTVVKLLDTGLDGTTERSVADATMNLVLESPFRLHSFEVYEELPGLESRIDLIQHKNQLKGLRNFSTNLANKSTMFDILSCMHVDARFKFYIGLKKDSYTVCDVLSKSDAVVLKLEKRSGQSGPTEPIMHSFSNLDLMRAFFEEQINDFPLDHWLDNPWLRLFNLSLPSQHRLAH